MIKVKKLNEDAIIPQYQTKGSAGFDFHSNEQTIIEPNKRCLIKTGIAIEIPEGYEIQVRSRSGLAIKHGISVLNSPGTIDSDYREEIGVILYNSGGLPFLVSVGDRIAQGVLQKVCQAAFLPVDSLTTTDRKGGFGSTGK